MAASRIEWTEVTWNPTTGCDRVSPGCDHCYALTMARRLKAMGQPKYQRDGDPRTSGPGFGITCHPDVLRAPYGWAGSKTVFVNSMSDLFHEGVPEDFIADVFAVMCDTPQHTYQVLTKRSKRLAELATRLEWPENVWMGVTVETDRYAFRARHLRAVPAAVRFISAEPLLGALPSLELEGIHWLIAGGESGPHARPMHPAWVRDLRDRCRAAGTAFFFKQWGAWRPRRGAGTWVDLDGTVGERAALVDGHRLAPAHVDRLGKTRAGRRLDGRTWDQLPSTLTVGR